MIGEGAALTLVGSQTVSLVVLTSSGLLTTAQLTLAFDEGHAPPPAPANPPFAGVTISLIVAVPLGCSVTAAEVQVTVTGLPAPVQVQPGSVPVVAVNAKLLGR